MKEITKDVLKECAHRLLFDMTEEQYDLLMKEFDIVLQQMSRIGDQPEVDNYAPMTFPFDVMTDQLREDAETETITLQEALQNAKDVVEDQIRLPKVVG